MRALQFHDALDVRIDEVDPPAGPLTGSAVLVRSVLCGICGTDLHEYRIGPLLTSVQPKILGHEPSAVAISAVDAAGKRYVAEFRPTSLLGRPTTPDEVAKMVVFLASDHLTATVGPALRVDGGVLANSV